MASQAAVTAETVGQALRDLALSCGNQEGLSEFLTTLGQTAMKLRSCVNIVQMRR